jgi:beta-lactamase regulating signal transducer with metallopeptidase domain
MDQWLADSLVRAICWTLVHSLWQGLILAAVAGILVLLTRKSVAALRYNLLATLFFVFMAVVAFTFVYELRISAPANTVINLTQTPAVPVADPLLLPDNAVVQVYHEEGFVTRFSGYFNQHASLIVTIWFIIFLAKAVKLMGGLAYIQRIRNHKVYAPATKWAARLEELAGKLGVRMPVRLLESGLVKVPLVAGFLKPIILVPVGLMANLPADQVEAILLHELAHIRRRDFIVNLVQSFAEILFFFNPAVLWLSSLLREEREHCCDDMAIAVTQSKKEYIEALVSFQEYQLDNTGHFAMAFPGKKNQLLNRVKRIIGNRNKSLNMAEKSFLALCLCITCILSVVVSQTKQSEKPVKKAAIEKKEQSLPVPANRNAASGKSDNSIIPEVKEPDELIVKHQAGDSTSDQAKDSSGLPYLHQYDSSYHPDYQPYQPSYKPYEPAATDTIPVFHNRSTVITGVITTTKDGKQYKISVEKNKTTGLTIDGERVPNSRLADYYPVLRIIYDEMAAEAEKSYNDRIRESEDNKRKLEQQNNELKRQLAEEDRKVDNLKVNMAPLQTEGKLQLREPISPLKPTNFKTNPKVAWKKSSIKPERSPADDIIDDMVAAGIVKETNPLSFRLNTGEFVVNDVPQPETVLRRFQDKYIKHRGDNYTYSKNGGTTRTSITRE